MGAQLDVNIHLIRVFTVVQAKDQEYTVCAGQERHQDVYTSYGNEVEVQVPQQHPDEPGEKLNFLLQYQGMYIEY